MSQVEFKENSPAPRPLPLREESAIMSTWEKASGVPLVSICCATFNHARYLEDALRGFLGQVTSFPFEIIVRDDASTDGTTELLLKYAARYPNIIRAVVEKENLHSKGIRANPTLVPLARGEFVALCEGDDYWITEEKLQKQVDLMHKYPQATMSVACTVLCKTNDDDSLICENVFGHGANELLDFEEVKTKYFHTSTYLIRSGYYRQVLAQYLNKIEYGDTSLRYMLADIGPFAVLDEIVSVYRVTGEGIWTSLNTEKKVEWEIKATEGFFRHFNPAHRQYFGQKLFILFKWMMQHGKWNFGNRSPSVNLLWFTLLSFRYGLPFYFGRFWRLLKR